MSPSAVHQKPDIITRSESLAMKGVGILLIASHNLAHTLGVTGYDCNEFYFDRESADTLFQCILHPTGNLLIQLSTLLGYCGIHIFLFISAFGLVRKYEQGTAAMPAPHTFVWQHYAKLFRLMLPGFLAALGAMALLPDLNIPGKKYLLTQMLMIGNWFYPPYSHTFIGPYWFLGLMVELYVVYRLMLYVPQGGAGWRKWLLPVAFAALTLIPQFFWCTENRTMIALRYNFFVAGLSFGAGLLVARYGGIPRMSRIGWACVWLLSCAAFILMQNSPALWLLSALVAVVGIIAFVKALPRALTPPMVWSGKISAFLFIVHPVVRYFAFPLRGVIENHLLIVLYLTVSLLLAAGYHRLAPHIPWPKFMK